MESGSWTIDNFLALTVTLLLGIVTVLHAHRWISMDYLHSERYAPTAVNVTLAIARKRQVPQR